MEHNSDFDDEFDIIERDIDNDFFFEGLEDIDSDILEQLLDFISDIPEELSPSTQDMMNLRRDPRFLSLMSELGDLSVWNLYSDEEIPICLQCMSTNCEHINNSKTRKSPFDIEQEIKSRKCNHKRDNDLFDDICTECLIEFYSEIDFKAEANIMRLWNDFDIAAYYNWYSQLGMSQGFNN